MEFYMQIHRCYLSCVFYLTEACDDNIYNILEDIVVGCDMDDIEVRCIMEDIEVRCIMEDIEFGALWKTLRSDVLCRPYRTRP
jgi:hypothetical protein